MSGYRNYVKQGLGRGQNVPVRGDPVTLVTGSSIDVIDICIDQPVGWVFRRPLGEF